MSEAFAERPKVREPFICDNDMKAEWCLKKIRKVKEDAASEIAELKRQMEFYQNEMEMVQEEANEDVAFFEGILQKYFRSRVDEGFTKSSKTQTVYKLPTGKLILKKQEPVYSYKDEAFLKWLKDNKQDKFIKVEETAQWGEFKKTLKDKDGNIPTISEKDGIIRVVDKNGEIVPGVSVTFRDDEFKVEV